MSHIHSPPKEYWENTLGPPPSKEEGLKKLREELIRVTESGVFEDLLSNMSLRLWSIFQDQHVTLRRVLAMQTKQLRGYRGVGSVFSERIMDAIYKSYGIHPPLSKEEIEALFDGVHS